MDLTLQAQILDSQAPFGFPGLGDMDPMIMIVLTKKNTKGHHRPHGHQHSHCHGRRHILVRSSSRSGHGSHQSLSRSSSWLSSWSSSQSSSQYCQKGKKTKRQKKTKTGGLKAGVDISRNSRLKLFGTKSNTRVKNSNFRGNALKIIHLMKLCTV